MLKPGGLQAGSCSGGKLTGEMQACKAADGAFLRTSMLLLDRVALAGSMGDRLDAIPRGDRAREAKDLQWPPPPRNGGKALGYPIALVLTTTTGQAMSKKRFPNTRGFHARLFVLRPKEFSAGPAGAQADGGSNLHRTIAWQAV